MSCTAGGQNETTTTILEGRNSVSGKFITWSRKSIHSSPSWRGFERNFNGFRYFKLHKYSWPAISLLLQLDRKIVTRVGSMTLKAGEEMLCAKNTQCKRRAKANPLDTDAYFLWSNKRKWRFPSAVRQVEENRPYSKWDWYHHFS